MTQYAFYLNVDNCIGCKVCGMACMEKNDLLPGMRFRRILLNSTGSWEKDASGLYVANGVQPLRSSGLRGAVSYGRHGERLRYRHRVVRSRDLHRVRHMR